jgi:prepilin-type N-terminal cleavage/methylation domain-containing protein
MPIAQKNRKAGFTLIELMIAMVVTMVLLYAAVLAFKDASQSNSQVTLASDMSGNLRASLDMIQQDLIQAGTGIPTTGIPIPFTSNGSVTAPCGTTAAINRPVLGGTTTFPQCNSVLPAVEPGSMLGPPITAPDAVAGTVANPNSITDEITIIYADNSSGLDLIPVNRPASGPTPACNGSISVNGQVVSFDTSCFNPLNPGVSATPIAPNDLIMFSNSWGVALQAITSASGATLNFAPGDKYGLNGRTDPSGTILQLKNPGCTTPANCWPPTTVTRVWMISYYLDNVADPQHVRLMRQVGLNAPTAVGETLENLQFTYNFFDSATNPTNQSAVPAGDSEAQIRSVNVYIGARSSYSVRQGNRSFYARDNLMTQVSLRSLAFVNKYN